jgi:hypothetical protein
LGINELEPPRSNSQKKDKNPKSGTERDGGLQTDGAMQMLVGREA